MEYRIDPPKPGALQWALAVVSNVTEHQGTRTVMVDRVQLLHQDVLANCKKAMAKLFQVVSQLHFREGPKASKVHWPEGRPPSSAKKARRLSAHPTAEDLPGDTEVAMTEPLAPMRLA